MSDTGSEGATALPARRGIQVWRPADLDLLELHRGIGVHRPVPRHWHEEFQFCYIESGVTDLTYRGVDYPTPPASLFIVPPGDVHSNRSFEPSGCTYRTLFVAPVLLSRAACEISGRDPRAPFLRATVLFDRDLVSAFVCLHKALEMPSSTLERESLLASFISTLLVRYSDAGAPSKRYGGARTGTRRACEYLREHFAENVSLARLAAVAGISPFHLHRRFSEHLGMPPHSFLTQLRVARARTLLRQGLSISEVATLTGFADQSHLTRHFKRFVGLTPGAYRAKSKNVQDGGERAH